MSQNVNEPLNPIPWVHSCPVATEEVTAASAANKVKEMLDSQRRRPNPAHGAPMPKSVRFFA